MWRGSPTRASAARATRGGAGASPLDHAAACPWEWPSARAASRIAERGRYVMTFATCAALWRP